MFQSFVKSVGLAPVDAYIEPRLSIGNAVADRDYSTGDFKIKIDAEARALLVKNKDGRIILKSLHNLPFLSSCSGKVEITAAEGDSAVFKITEHNDHPTRLQTVTFIGNDGDRVVIRGGLGVKLVTPTHMDYELIFKSASPHRLQFSARITHQDPNMANHQCLIMTFQSREEEDFYGFGGQSEHVSLKGQKVPIWNREHGFARGSNKGTSIIKATYKIVEDMLGGDSTCTTSICTPQYISSDNRCLFLETYKYCSFDLTHADRVVIKLEDSQMTGSLLDATCMLDLMTEYTSYCGRMLPLPEWISEGVVAGIQGGAEKVTRIIQQLKEHDIPTAAVWLPDWTGERLQPCTRSGVQYKRSWWNWESEDKSYPEWNKFIQDLGTRVLTYVNPLLVAKEGSHREFYKEARENGYLVMDSNRSPITFECDGGISAGLLDLTNEEAQLWFKNILKQMWADGVSGMMIDCVSCLPFDKDLKLNSGIESSAYHNNYVDDWIKINQEVIQELGLEKEAVSFNTSAFTHSPSQMMLLSVGNRNVSWDLREGIKGAVTCMLSAGFSGFTVSHSDIGGSNTIEGILPGVRMSRSRDLLYRWMELAAFTAVYRTHEGFLPELNAQFFDDEDTFKHFSHNWKLYHSLRDYRNFLLREAYEKGWPLLRHLVLYYASDAVARKISYSQFLLGSSLMIAPVLSPSTSFVKVYFPKELGTTWRHIWTGKYFQADGDYKSVDAPYGQPAVFVKEPRDDNGLLNALIAFANDYSDYRVEVSSAARKSTSE